MAAGQHRTGGRSTLVAVFAGVVSPPLAARLATPLDDDPAPLAAAVAVLRGSFAVDDPTLLLVLEGAGVRVGEAARLVGVDVRRAHTWLDRELDQQLGGVVAAPRVVVAPDRAEGRQSSSSARRDSSRRNSAT